MNFIFERSAQHLMSDRREWMRYWVEHEKIGCVSTSRRVIFCLFYKPTNYEDFSRFSESFRPFSEDFRRFSKIVPGVRWTLPNVFWTFPNIFLRLPKIAEDCWRQPKKIRRCFEHTSTTRSVVEGTKEKSYQKGMISSQCKIKIVSSLHMMKIWYPHMWRYHFW